MLDIREVYSAKTIATVYDEVASNKQAYLGEGLFPIAKKMGLDLKWIKASKGLPVSLKPSAFDTVSTIRAREGAITKETQMAYFKESMAIDEIDEMEFMRVSEASDPFIKPVIDKIYDDATTLVEGAEVVQERMRMQLLSAKNGHPSISFSADGATYEYDYDADGTFATNNYNELLSKKWNDVETSDPMADIEAAQDAIEALTGSRPSRMIVSKETFNYIKANKKVQSAILAKNVSATVFINEARVKELFATELGINIIVYTKMYKDDDKVVQKFFPDGVATLIPEGALGKTWLGTTPDERVLMSKPEYDTKLVKGGIAVTVTTSSDPVKTKTTVSEVVLPSFERMDEVYVIKCY